MATEFYIHLILEFRPAHCQQVEISLPNTVSLHDGTSLINELKAPFIDHLKTTNNADGTKLLPKVLLLVDLVTNIVIALLNEEDLRALIEFVCECKFAWITTKLQGVE